MSVNLKNKPAIFTMKDTEVFELYVWKGDWGLPSIGTDCLLVLSYAKFNGIPLKVNMSSNPFKTPNGRLPVLKCGTTTLDTASDIIEFFRGKNYNSEHALDCNECGKIMAYDVLLKDKLLPALQFIWWLDEKNVTELVKPWYYKVLPFPLNFYYPGKFERQAHTMFEAIYPTEEETSAIETQVYSEAQKCLTLLSIKLGDSKYFFGHQPTVLDATIYSYLAPLLKAPLPNPALQNHLKACTNLVKYVSRISQRYFENEYQEYERQKAEDNAKKLKKDSESEFPNKRRNQVLAGLFAAWAMASYAVENGLVEVPEQENEMLDEPPEYVMYDEDDE